MSEEAKSFSMRLEKAIGIPVQMVDERLSSWEAKRTVASRAPQKPALRGSQARIENRNKVHLDDVAAAIFLRDYLELVRGKAGEQH